MIRYISILRGINVGGKRKIIMKDLTQLYQNLGFTNVKTYIQSGNVVFNCKVDNHQEIEDLISEAIQKEYGFEVPVLVRSKVEWLNIKNANPFLEEDINQLHITMLKQIPESEKVDFFKTFDSGPDRFYIEDRNIYICCGGAYRDTKLSNNLFEKKLGTNATTRNWKTFMKLLSLSEEEN